MSDQAHQHPQSRRLFTFGAQANPACQRAQNPEKGSGERGCCIEEALVLQNTSILAGPVIPAIAFRYPAAHFRIPQCATPTVFVPTALYILRAARILPGPLAWGQA